MVGAADSRPLRGLSSVAHVDGVVVVGAGVVGGAVVGGAVVGGGVGLVTHCCSGAAISTMEAARPISFP
jgi:uncharacterized membrane protein YedE/YeeE